MLNTVVLFTPPNHRIACSTTCGHLRPIVANTVSTKSMLAHLLSTINHCFEIIRVFGHLYFRCYTTWSFGYIEFEMSIWSKISRSTRQSGVFRFIWPFYQVADFLLGRPTRCNTQQKIGRHLHGWEFLSVTNESIIVFF